jgi:predicted ribosome quality control (RQC) complex YloA/Tae2 family protein
MPAPFPALLAAAPPLPLDPALEGARIQGVRQTDEENLWLETHRSGEGAAHWRVSLHPEQARLGRVFRPPPRGGAPPVFCQWLRSRLVGGRVETLRRPHPQLVVLTVAGREARHHLVLELNRRHSNLLLLDGDANLLIALRHPALPGRSLGAGRPYLAPPRFYRFPGGIPLAERLPAPDAASARALEAGWQARVGNASLADRWAPALRMARREVKRLTRRLEKLGEDGAEAGQTGLWRWRGELLQIHRAHLAPGQAEVEVPDVFQPGQPPVRVPLDPLAGVGENIERCFRRYRKLRDGVRHVARREAETRRALEVWQGVHGILEQGGAPDAREALRALLSNLPPEAAALKPLLDDAAAGTTRARKARDEHAPRGVMRRLSADGYTILVGRSREENDEVTFRLGRGRDWWFHAQGLPGSHVLVLNPGDGPLPGTTRREAAWLAAYYSQGRASGRVEVDYTQRKYVRRRKGGAPGEVTFSGERSLAVDLSDETLRAVLERPG